MCWGFRTSWLRLKRLKLAGFASTAMKAARTASEATRREREGCENKPNAERARTYAVKVRGYPECASGMPAPDGQGVVCFEVLLSKRAACRPRS